jgi:cell fate (sporulation/competence/biofilm development) regulator YlbF (YheA/YmcA/DUF963 family)
MHMLNTELHHTAEIFVATLRTSDTFRAFVEAQAAFQRDAELQEIRTRFNVRFTELQGRQTTGTLTQDEINELRALQSRLNAHPTTVRYINTRQAMLAMLQECNGVLSKELGFDFASAAAPASCCG